MVFDIVRREYRAGDIFIFVPQSPEQVAKAGVNVLQFGVFKKLLSEEIGVFYNHFTNREETWGKDLFQTRTKHVSLESMPFGDTWNKLLAISDRIKIHEQSERKSND